MNKKGNGLEIILMGTCFMLIVIAISVGAKILDVAQTTYESQKDISGNQNLNADELFCSNICNSNNMNLLRVTYSSNLAPPTCYCKNNQNQIITFVM